ncbi:MAG: flagellar basal body rod protein FlgC [Rhodoblastus sp.]
MDPLQTSIRVAGSALQAQAIRMRVVSENIANAQTSANSPDSEPYRRKTVTFGEQVSREEHASFVAIKKIGRDDGPLRVVRDPGNPAANAKGEVLMPNVDPVLELADMREANHGYQASLQIIRQARDLFSMTLDILKT